MANSPDQNPTSTPNAWDEVMGPFYDESGLLRRGEQPSEDLIAITSTEGIKLYPHAQFDVVPDTDTGIGTLHRRDKVLEIWGELIIPAINEGILNEYTAAAYMTGSTGVEHEDPSLAVCITFAEDSPKVLNAIILNIKRTIGAMRQ